MAVSPKLNKPYALRGKEPLIVEYRDEKGLRWEEIAVLVGASRTGVIDAYNREKQKAPGSAEGLPENDSSTTNEHRTSGVEPCATAEHERLEDVGN